MQPPASLFAPRTRLVRCAGLALGIGLLGLSSGPAYAWSVTNPANRPSPINRIKLSSSKIHVNPRAVLIAHIALAPGPQAVATLRAFAPDLILYTGPPHPPGDARARLTQLATVAPTWGVRDTEAGDPFAGTGVRVTHERLHLELAGQDLGLVCAEGPVLDWARLLARMPSADTYNIVAARTADGAVAAAAAGGKGVDLYLAATAGKSGRPVGLSTQGATRVHIAGGGAPTIFTVGR